MRKTLLLTAVIILAAGLMFAWAGKETGVNSLNSQSNVEVSKVTIPTNPNPSADGLKKEAEVKAQIAEMEAKKAERAKSPASDPTLTSQGVIAEPAITEPAPGNLANSVDREAEKAAKEIAVAKDAPLGETVTNIAPVGKIADEQRMAEIKADGVISADEMADYEAISERLSRKSDGDFPVILVDLDEGEPNEPCENATAMNVGDRIFCAELNFGDPQDSTDYFVFTLYDTYEIVIETHYGTVECEQPTINDTKLYLYDADCVNQLAYDDDGGEGMMSKIEITLAAGEYVAKATPYSSYTTPGSYHLTLIEYVPCEVECPVSSIDEGEGCGNDTNGGCNSSPWVFGSIACEDTVCGSGWADAGTRDTDWYMLAITGTQQITMTVCAEFSFLFGVIEQTGPGDCDNSGSVNPYGIGDACDTLTVTATVPYGEGWPVILFVAPSGFYDYPCDLGDTTYWMTVTCGDVLGSCCDDATGDCWDDFLESQCDPSFRWTANVDCVDLQPPCGGCTEDMILINILTDTWPEETTWEVVDHDTQVPVASGGPYDQSGHLYIEYVCVATESCHDFTIYDSYGDGIYSPGYYEVYLNYELVCANYNFGGSEETCELIGNGCVFPTGACCVGLDCVATNYEAECDVLGGIWYEGEDCFGDPPFECPEVPLCLIQLPNQSNGIFSDIDCDICPSFIQVLAENFTNGNVTIQGLTFWGGYYPNNLVMDPDDFEVIFYTEDAAGLPGTEIGRYSDLVATDKFDTGIDLFGVDEYQYYLTLDPAFALTPGRYFVEIYNNTIDNTDSWFWEVGDLDPIYGIIGQAWSPSMPEPPWNYDSATDMSLILDCGGEPPTGACCVGVECVATNTQAECSDLGGDWYVGEDCFGDPPFECPTEPTGACCVDEVCVATNFEAECDVLGGDWYVGEDCFGDPPFECPVYEDPCEFAIYNNGAPGVSGGATATQCDPVYPFAAGVADDFELGGTVPIALTEVVAWIGHWNATPLATPADYDGVNVTIYAHDPTNNMPGGQPIDGDPDCQHQDNMPPNGIVYTVFLAQGSFNYTDESAIYGYDCWMLQLPVSVTVDPNTMYWLEVQPVFSFAAGYGQSGWIPTDLQTGAYAMQIFELLEMYPWQSLLVDMAFCLNAEEAPEYCESWGNNGWDWITNVTIGDINNTTGQETDGYGDYTALSDTVTQGWSHNLSVSFVNDGDECIRAWIDWDQNWTFDADELYEVGYGAPGPFDIDITVPMEASLGETRMRVQIKWSICGEPCETDFWGETEDYTLVVAEFPCDIVCEGTDEGEPICYDGYDDVYNAGCNMLPENEPIFGSITCGETICGTSGTHLDSEGTPVRDTDWFEFDVTVEQQFTLTVEAEFSVTIGIIVPGFDDLEDPVDPCSVSTITYYAVGGPCQVITVQEVLGVGEFGYYWVWIGPQVGAEVECGKEYAATLTCAPPPTGACCIDYECVATTTETECMELSEWGDWHEGETCPEFICPVPLQEGLATTQNIPDCGVSNYGPIGETDTQGNTYAWSGNPPADFAGTFVMGNAADMMFSYYNPGVTDCYEYTPTGVLDMTDTYHPTAPYSDGGVMGGMKIEYCGHGFHTDFGDPAEAGDIFVHVLTLTNVSGAQIADYYAGMYIDWDVGADDFVTMDRANNVIYQGAAGTPLYGLCLVNADEVNLRSLTAVSQWDYIYPTGSSPPGGWQMEHLHYFMSFDGDQIADSHYTDMSQLISTGPYTFEDGESVTIQIACIGAPDAATMEARAQYTATLDLPVCELDGPEGYQYLAGDVNMALGLWPPSVIGGDVTYLVGYFIGGGQASCLLDGFWCSADINGDCTIIGGDVTALVQYFVAGGPLVPCPDYPSVWPPVPDDPPVGWPNCETPPINVKVIPTDSVR